jgi:hypothetical protein
MTMAQCRGHFVIVRFSKTTKGDTVDQVAKAAAELGYKFQMAIDNSWNTTEKFWIHSAVRLTVFAPLTHSSFGQSVSHTNPRLIA